MVHIDVDTTTPEHISQFPIRRPLNGLARPARYGCLELSNRHFLRKKTKEKKKEKKKKRKKEKRLLECKYDEPVRSNRQLAANYQPRSRVQIRFCLLSPLKIYDTCMHCLDTLPPDPSLPHTPPTPLPSPPPNGKQLS